MLSDIVWRRFSFHRNLLMPEKKKLPAPGINTRLTHKGYDPHEYHGFVNPPVVHASTVLFGSAAEAAAYNKRFTYGTTGTPTSEALGRAMDSLEGSAGTIVVGSGLAAVTVPLTGFASAGDHVLITDSVYFPTRRFADNVLANFGVEVEYFDPLIGAGISNLLRDNTSIVFTESPGSNTFEVQDIPAISKAAHDAGAVMMMDNTWATPLFFKPLDHGVDISIHATTKYPGGHSDLVSGTVSANEAHWEKLWNTFKYTGACAGPDDAYQVLRGLRTMGVRLERHQISALEIARWLAEQEGVARVLHPALETSAGHDIWKRDFCGSSGLFSIVLDGGGREQVHAFMNALTYFGMGASWGGYESLVSQVSLKDRVLKQEFEGPLIRLNIGLEDVADLKADLENGLAAAASA